MKEETGNTEWFCWPILGAKSTASSLHGRDSRSNIIPSLHLFISFSVSRTRTSILSHSPVLSHLYHQINDSLSNHCANLLPMETLFTTEDQVANVSSVTPSEIHKRLLMLLLLLLPVLLLLLTLLQAASNARQTRSKRGDTRAKCESSQQESSSSSSKLRGGHEHSVRLRETA